MIKVMLFVMVMTIKPAYRLDTHLIETSNQIECHMVGKQMKQKMEEPELFGHSETAAIKKSVIKADYKCLSVHFLSSDQR